MTSPDKQAAVIMDWYRDVGRQEPASIDGLDDDHLVLQAISSLAVAADADDEALRTQAISALFAGVVEPLNDSFEPQARACYARLFARVIWTAAQRHPALASRLAADGITNELALRQRHACLRANNHQPPLAAVKRIAVLSRVTLGADILITSVVAQRCRQAWPEAEIVIIGDPKLGGLLGGLEGVRIAPLHYARRGPLGQRLSAWLTLREQVEELAPDLVVAPDSRLDQLGLLPLTRDPERTLLWENTQPDATAPQSLATLVDAWCAQRLGLAGEPSCQPRIAFDPAGARSAAHWRQLLAGASWCAVKLDHGGNPSKALGSEAETQILQALRDRGWRILIDYGFGDDEMAASDQLLASLGWPPLDVDDSARGGIPVGSLDADRCSQASVIRFHGSITGWAAAVAACAHALSYDSVGHHLAAALGVSLTSVFTGHSGDAFPVAWQPRGPGTVQQIVIPTAERLQPDWWQRVITSLPTPPV